MAGIRVCPDCALSLVYEPPLKEPHEPAEGDELVAVATFQIVFDASVARGALEAEGMPAFVPGDLSDRSRVSRTMTVGQNSR